MQDVLLFVSRKTILFINFLHGSSSKTPGHHFSECFLVDLSSSTQFNMLSVSLSHILHQNVDCTQGV